MAPSYLFVCLFGMGTVFVGLTCIILLVYLMGAIFQKIGQKPAAAPAAAPAVTAAPAEIPNRQAMIAAVSAVLAEENGTDVKGIRILSFKKI